MYWQKQNSIFILFEGGEGSGKTTQAQLLYGALKRIGRRVIYNDEPGSTKIGFKIRSIVMDADRGEVDPLTEFLLFEVDRSLDFEKNIIPSLEEGIDVVQDRNFGTTFAYQGYGRGLIKTEGNLMRLVDKAARRGVRPDLIFLLDADPRKSLKRTKQNDTFEQETFVFHRLARQGFLTQAKADKKRWVILNASQPPEVLHQKVWEKVSTLLQKKAPTR